METLIISGKVANANSCVTIITVAGPNGYSHQETKKGNFDISLAVKSGLHVIYIHGDTDGILKINITGDLTTVDPGVPMNLTANYSQVFHAIV
jgi:hypothetical protein